MPTSHSLKKIGIRYIYSIVSSFPKCVFSRLRVRSASLALLGLMTVAAGGTDSAGSGPGSPDSGGSVPGGLSPGPTSRPVMVAGASTSTRHSSTGGCPTPVVPSSVNTWRGNVGVVRMKTFSVIVTRLIHLLPHGVAYQHHHH